MTNPGVQLDLVFWFVERGFSIIPVHLRSKQPKIKWGKYQNQLPTHDELIKWFRVPSNAAVVTGTNNLVVIDFDSIQEYVAWSLWAIDGPKAAQQILRDAYKVRTARGIHVYTRSSSDVRNLHYGKIDVKGHGGLVTLPGSIHPSGAVYTEYGGSWFPLWNDLKEILPSWMLEDNKVYEAPKQVVREDLSMLDKAAVLDRPAMVSVDLNELKKRYRIENMIEGISFTGDHWGVAKCPLHEDNSPSFWIDLQNQLCGCFTCTPVPMDVINLYAKLNHLSNQEAIREMSRG